MKLKHLFQVKKNMLPLIGQRSKTSKSVTLTFIVWVKLGKPPWTKNAQISLVNLILRKNSGDQDQDPDVPLKVNN